MLVCNVSLRPPRTAIAAAVAEISAAVDALASGNVVFATLVDDPASVGDIVDAYSGEIMIEAASASDAWTAAMPVLGVIIEGTTATDTQDGAPPPSAWTPANLGFALRAWYKFDALTGSDGDLQGSVTDASINGFTLTQTGTARPMLAAAHQNGLNTLRWNIGVANQFYPLANAIFSGSSAGSAYIVFRLFADVSNMGLMDWGSSGNSSHWPYIDGNIYCDFGSNVRKTVGNPSVTQEAYRIYSIYSAASDWAFYIDGGTGGPSGGTSPFYSTASNTVGWNAGSVQLGNNSAANYLNGWIAEIVFTNAKQSTTDRQKMEGYLAHKWGLTGNLDSTHPYKSTPPPP